MGEGGNTAELGTVNGMDSGSDAKVEGEMEKQNSELRTGEEVDGMVRIQR